MNGPGQIPMNGASDSAYATTASVLNESNIPFRVDLHVWDGIPRRFHEIIRSDFVILSETTPSPRGWVRSGNVAARRGAESHPECLLAGTGAVDDHLHLFTRRCI